MITVDFGEGETRSNEKITTKWLQTVCRKRLFEHNTIRVDLHIDREEVQLSLTSGKLPEMKGPEKEQNKIALRLVHLWQKHGLNQEKISYRNLEAFIKKLFNLFGMKLRRV